MTYSREEERLVDEREMSGSVVIGDGITVGRVRSSETVEAKLDENIIMLRFYAQNQGLEH